MSESTWRLSREDGTAEEFMDVRRKVGNRVIRAYLLQPLLDTGSALFVKASLRGPKGEFQDFAKFFVLGAQYGGRELRFLVESGVYENLRIVAADRESAAGLEPDAIVRVFTEVLTKPDECKAQIWLSTDTKVHS
ncbi:MAG: hypothetical protein HXY34_11255 [Candidatus Thorarchaeota archaeon]|nr:hypothetical protein [Candidatus Thorarchaeota archaeon]